MRKETRQDKLDREESIAKVKERAQKENQEYVNGVKQRRAMPSHERAIKSLKWFLFVHKTYNKTEPTKEVVTEALNRAKAFYEENPKKIWAHPIIWKDILTGEPLELSYKVIYSTIQQDIWAEKNIW